MSNVQKINRYINFRSTLYCIATVLIILLDSCSNDREEAVTLFKNKKSDFIALKNYVQSKYIIPIHDDKPRLIFIRCNEMKSYFIDQICDDSLSRWMDVLNINQINLEHDFHCKSSNKLNEINLRYDKTEYFPTFYYRYSFCIDTLNYKSSSIESEYLGDGWSLYIEKN